MAIRQHFQKALMLLDHGDIDRGETILRQVIVDAGNEDDQVALVQSLVCLGNLLYETSRHSEARPYLEQALQVKGDDDLDDLLSYEFEKAREILDGLNISPIW